MDLTNYPRIKEINLDLLKRMSYVDIEDLAEEIRQFLINELSVTGGHLAPNLGVVELTLALFRQFDSPTDRFFWDIGHQSYVHKILTGRAQQFDTLRQFNGLSGFMKMEESAHDAWEAGHASTSLSGASGLSVQRKLQGKNYHIVSIIGDGALTGGMALEALNHIGYLGLPHIIILNDNEMSISKNVGALNKHITDLRLNPKYLNIKSQTKIVLSRNKFGQRLTQVLNSIKESLKNFLVSTKSNNFFVNMGITYLGPIDGHNLKQLEQAFAYAKKASGPVVLHISTKKGRGYSPAENDAKGSWHGIGPYLIEAGEKVRKKDKSLRQWSSVVSETLERLAMQDEQIIAITPAMIKGSKLTFFANKYPERIFDVGIAEEHAMTFAAGAALQGGLKPFLAIYSSFLQRAYDQLLHDVARQKLHVVIGVDRCGFAGGDGETHHGVYDIALMRTIPGLVVVMGKDDVETQQLIYNAFYKYEGPVALRYPRGYTKLDYVSTFEAIPLGSWEYIHEAAEKEFVILTFGPQIKTAEQVVKQHERDNISIVNARFIKPMDETMLTTIFNTYQKVITIEEGTLHGGFGSGVLAFAQEHGFYNTPILTHGLKDVYYPQGDNTTLYQLAEIDVVAIQKTIAKHTTHE